VDCRKLVENILCQLKRMNIGLDSSEVMVFMSVTKNAQDKKIWACRIAKIIGQELSSIHFRNRRIIECWWNNSH